MLNQRLAALDRETVIALIVLWAMGFGTALALGKSIAPAAGLSLLAIGCLSLGYIVADAETRRMAAHPVGAVCFFAGGCVLAALSFAGDCWLGSTLAPDIPLMEACIEKSGVGFAFTVACAALAVGIPVVGLMRSLVLSIWGRSG